MKLKLISINKEQEKKFEELPKGVSISGNIYTTPYELK